MAMALRLRFGFHAQLFMLLAFLEPPLNSGAIGKAGAARNEVG